MVFKDDCVGLSPNIEQKMISLKIITYGLNQNPFLLSFENLSFLTFYSFVYLLTSIEGLYGPMCAELVP